ncbi:MAG: HPr family phosphocarrier protein [Acidobacteria bacterium]|nr:HPr family phosphocarrier protein [Acidobacteriota bacterium]
MLSRQVTVGNVLGLHARAAARFVHTAGTFAARVRVSRDGREMDGKSILGLLLLAAGRGAVLTITTDGPDEAGAMESLVRLVEEGFGEPCV